MSLYNRTFDLLTTASHINTAGHELAPHLRALPAPMLRTCADLAAILADADALAALGSRVMIEMQYATIPQPPKAISAEGLAPTRVLRDRLAMRLAHRPV